MHKLDIISQDATSEHSSKSPFPIVGIGASAGGLEALEQFFKNTPLDSGMAYVVIQHLDPTHVGILPEILQRITQLKVNEVEDGMIIVVNSIYVIPSNKSMSILNGVLHLFDPIESHGLRLPIDFFFRSLANDKQGCGVGIILSGMGSDGSLGLKAIKESNGLVLVQDPLSAQFDGMPRSAIAAVIPDVVGAPAELPRKLIEIMRFIPIQKTETPLEVDENGNLDKIIILLRERCGHDFSLYKKTTLFRRIARRKGVHQIASLKNYVRFCQENPSELELLFKELLIGVTSFFRDPAVWEELVVTIIPQLIATVPNGTVLRAWVTACSTGEEAYSLAIAFLEAMEKLERKRNVSLQIFATDLDNEAIVEARKGVYSFNTLVDVTPERISRYFNLVEEQYVVNNTIREMVIFACQNIIKDPPFTKIDLLTCRNMLIYMEPELQVKIISMFNYSINPNGIMVLGSAERLGTKNEGFNELDTKLKIYKRNTTIPTSILDFPSSFRYPKQPLVYQEKPASTIENIQAMVDQIIIQHYSPASVLVNESGDILYITGRTGKYLEPVAGKANWNVLAMARKGLGEILPTALREAKKSQDPVVLSEVRIESHKLDEFINVIVQRLDHPNSVKGNILIVFSDLSRKLSVELTKGVKPKHQLSSSMHHEIEQELQQKNDELSVLREDMQTSQEELKSTNEELQSTNEELQSTNEELTTSKEEMQSMNEELHSLNSELQLKIVDFVQAEGDMKNLLNSTEIATLFVDKELKIRRFTDAITQVFKLRPSDVNRPFTELVTDLEYSEIELDARQVLKTLVMHEAVKLTRDGRWFAVKIMPYRTNDDRIDGVVLTFVDVTVSKKLEISLVDANSALQLKDEALKLSMLRYQKLFESSREGILILDAKTGLIKDVNPFLIELLGYSSDSFFEKSIWEISSFKKLVPNRSNFLELLQNEITRHDQLTLETADGSTLNVEFVSNVYSMGEVKEVQCVIREI